MVKDLEQDGFLVVKVACAQYSSSSPEQEEALRDFHGI